MSMSINLTLRDATDTKKTLDIDYIGGRNEFTNELASYLPNDTGILLLANYTGKLCGLTNYKGEIYYPTFDKKDVELLLEKMIAAFEQRQNEVEQRKREFEAKIFAAQKLADRVVTTEEYRNAIALVASFKEEYQDFVDFEYPYPARILAMLNRAQDLMMELDSNNTLNCILTLELN